MDSEKKLTYRAGANQQLRLEALQQRLEIKTVQGLLDFLVISKTNELGIKLKLKFPEKKK
jgi:hypothetical protein